LNASFIAVVVVGFVSFDCSGIIDCEFVNQKLEERFSLSIADDNGMIEDLADGREKWLWSKIKFIYKLSKHWIS